MEKREERVEPEEEGTERKEQLVLEASWKSGADRSSHSCLARSPLPVNSNAVLLLTPH